MTRTPGFGWAFFSRLLKESIMTIENSELNSGEGLRNSNEGLKGGTGDGNRLVIADLARGFTTLPDPDEAPSYLPQNNDDGENYVGNMFDRGGFLKRPQGWER
jgi:hypothetical protein